MYQRVKAYIEEQHMLEKKDRVIVGVSGGADSVCLLFMLVKLQKEMRFGLTVVHIHHGLRGESADADENYVRALCEKLDVPFKRTGKLIVGFTEEHRERLKTMIARGEANGVPGMELIDRARMDEIDPSAGGNFAIFCPSSGILDPFTYTVALAENAANNGAHYHLYTEVTGAERLKDGRHLLHTSKGDFACRWVVNSAGLNSAKISAMLGIPG